MELEHMSEKTTAPPRNNFKSNVLRKHSTADVVRGKDPNFVYEWKTTDENHPHCLDKTGQLDDHEYGNPLGGFVTVPGWQPVTKQVDKRIKQIETRDDQGKGMDTLIRRGKQILCRMPKEEHEKYQLADAAYTSEMKRQIYLPERQGGENAVMTTVVSESADVDKLQLLKNSGHPIPGMS